MASSLNGRGTRWNRAASEAYTAAWNEDAEKMAAVVAELASLPDQYTVDPDQPLFGRGLGLDSVDVLELSLRVELEFGARLTSEDIGALGSINSIVERIRAIATG